jgi:hypothetical protein
MTKSMMIAQSRPGFALPTAILLLLCMTAGVVCAFARVSAEVRVVDNLRGETAAFAAAEAGLQRYLANGRNTPADTTIVLSSGSARVRATLVRAATSDRDTALYVIRSDGVVAGGAATPKGRRTVAQYAQHIRGRMELNAMWTSLGGLNKSGSSGTISGADACSQDSIAGVGVPDGMYSQSGDGPRGPLEGDPPLEQLGSAAASANQVKIDWPAVTNATAPGIRADVIVCYPGTDGYDNRRGPCGAWPGQAAWENDDYWPVILINGSTTLPSHGRGLLIVTGDLRLNGGDNWSGILMIGDQLVDNGAGSVSGAVLSGLNVLNGTPVEPSNARGTKQYQYDSCAIARATDGQSRFVQIPNAWVDNWAAW